MQLLSQRLHLQTIEFFNLPGSGTGPSGLSADQNSSGYAGPLAGGFASAIRQAFGGLAGQQVGAIVLVHGSMPRNCTIGQASRSDISPLRLDFPVDFPGEEVTI